MSKKKLGGKLIAGRGEGSTALVSTEVQAKTKKLIFLIQFEWVYPFQLLSDYVYLVYSIFSNVCRNKTTCKTNSNKIGIYMSKRLSNKDELVNFDKLCLCWFFVLFCFVWFGLVGLFLLAKYITLRKCWIKIVCKPYNFWDISQNIKYCEFLEPSVKIRITETFFCIFSFNNYY